MTTAGKLDLAGDGFFVLVDLLEAAKAGLPEEVPSPMDDRFSEIARAYRKADPALRQQVREQIPTEYWLPLLQLGDRCAEWALVDKDPKHLEDGLTAYCLEDFRFDAQENLVHLSRLWHAGKTLHARHHGDLQPGRAVCLAAGIAGAEQFFGAARGREVSLEHGPREISGRGPHPLSPPPPQRDGVARQVRAARPVAGYCAGSTPITIPTQTLANADIRGWYPSSTCRPAMFQERFVKLERN